MGERGCSPIRGLGVLLWASIPAACGPGVEPGLPPTRIVLITVDTLRDDSLALMPETLAFAEGGLTFEHAYAATATTQPTHASLFTGRHPWEHGVTRNGQVLGERFETLAERLRDRGFTTGGVAASFPMHADFGFAQGFDRYDDGFEELYVREWEGEAVEGGRFYSLAGDTTRKALAQLRSAEGELQFFWFHYFDPHDPYGDHQDDMQAWVGINHLLTAAGQRLPSVAGLVQRARGLYDDDVRALDRALAPLFEELRAGSEHFETHVLFTSDHGESFGEHGCLGHGKRLVPEQIAVPLFYQGPRKGADTEKPCGTVDVAATVLGLAGDPMSTSGRDLFAPRGGAPVAVGMRRTFEGRKAEQLLDGQRLPIQGERFYFIGEGRYVTGNAEVLYERDLFDRELTGEENAQLYELFRSFQERLEGTSATELEGRGVQDALRTLGYTD